VVWRSREGKVQLVTAPLGDKVILDGVTRRSILQLARERLTGEVQSGLEPVEIVERKFTMDDVIDAVQEGRIIEAFAAGTAVSIWAGDIFELIADNLIVFRLPSISN
jgi:branched-chain amino acid aminotransferase